MGLNINSIIFLANILMQESFDEKEFERFINTKGTKGFLKYQKNINSGTNAKYIQKELKRIISDDNYRDIYDFYLVKKNIERFNDDIHYIKENEEQIIDGALKEVYKIIPQDVKVSSDIYLYIGGIDGGFTIDRKKIFINYGKYIGQKEELVKILSHELYHSRFFSIKNRFIFFMKMLLKASPKTYEIIGKSIEEGIACLVQHGAMLKTDDPTGTLTKRNLAIVKEEFDRLNDILLGIKFSKINHKDIANLNIYVIGYHIISTIYNAEEALVLDDWTVNLEYGRIIDKYIEVCNENDIPSGFTDETIEWLIN